MIVAIILLLDVKMLGNLHPFRPERRVFSPLTVTNVPSCVFLGGKEKDFFFFTYSDFKCAVDRRLMRLAESVTKVSERASRASLTSCSSRGRRGGGMGKM